MDDGGGGGWGSVWMMGVGGGGVCVDDQSHQVSVNYLHMMPLIDRYEDCH